MPSKISYLRPWLAFLLIIVSTFIIYRSSLGSYFFQDDWFSLRISQVHFASDLIHFFAPRSDLIYYRPLGMQIPFFVESLFWGLNPIPFRIVTFILHLINTYFIYLILMYFLKNKSLSYCGAFIYAISAVHYVIFFWAATFAFVLAPFFYFTSFFSYIKNKTWLSFFLFCIGLLTNELVLTLGIVIALWEIIKYKKISIGKLLPFGFVTGVYGFFRLTVAHVPKTTEYNFSTNIHQLLINGRNFILWSFNWPDEIQNQFLSFFKLNHLFINDFFSIVFAGLLCVAVFLAAFVIIPLVTGTYSKKKKLLLKSQVLFGLLWFVITLLPVLFFSQHSFSYYLPIPLLGLVITGLTLFSPFMKLNTRLYSYGLLSLVVIVWIYSSLINIDFNSKIHWAPRRAILSKKLVEAVKIQIPGPLENSVIIIEKGNNEDSKWALGDQNALWYLFKNTTIHTFYGTYEAYLKSDLYNSNFEAIVVKL